MTEVMEGRLSRIERKLDLLEDALMKLDRLFVEMTTEQRVRDQERADERKALLALIPAVRDLQNHLERLDQKMRDDSQQSQPTLVSLPPTVLSDEPTQPGSTMLPAYPDEVPTGETPLQHTKEKNEVRQPTGPVSGWDVMNRAVGVVEGLAKGFVTYQRMWGFIVLGVFGPPGLAVGLAQAWMITHPEGAAPTLVQPVLAVEEPPAEESREERRSPRLSGPFEEDTPEAQ